MLPGSEQVLLAVLIVASTGLFVKNFLPKIRAVAAGLPDRPRTDHVGHRLGRAAREVFAQTRVVKGRPIVGVLHAIVFFGFLLFAPETVEHFLRAFGISPLDALLGERIVLFRGAMAVIATLVSIAILGLAIRRFVFVNSSPDPRSVTSGVVALFILLLMLTYLNGISAAPIAPKANWWLHALIILAFPHLIIKSKHLHILMAPVGVFLRTERLGDYLPLNLDFGEEAEAEEVTLGLETLRAVPRKMRLDFLTCVECRRCTDRCPAAIAGHDLDPRGFTLAGRKALLHQNPGDSVIGSVITDAALGVCVTCGACENICPVGVEHLQLLVGAKRAQALAIGKGVVAVDYFHAIETYGNPFSLPASERKKLLAELELPRFTGEPGEWLLWLGCVWGYNRDQRHAVAAFKQVLDAAGVRYGVLDEEPCCGHHSRRQGEENQYQELARRTIAALREHRVTRVVTGCPHCLHTLKRDDAALGLDPVPEVVHHSQLISRLLDDRALPLNGGLAGLAVTYHDPCYLARYEKIVEEPRAVLAAAGTRLHELPRRRSETLCCGGGAAGFVREVKTGRRLDEERRAEIAASGATALVTACPECRMMLDATLEETQDIAEVVARALHLPESAAVPAARAGTREGEPMLTMIADPTVLSARIREMFAQHPDEEMQLLDIAGLAHISGKLHDLREVADRLVADGELDLHRHGGGRYYRLHRTDDAHRPN